MSRLIRRCLLFVLVIALAGYGLWSQWRPTSHYLSDLRSDLALNLGSDRGRGNLLGIQPELFGADYRSALHLHRKLSAYLEQARRAGLLNAKTVVVLPEHIGTWLIAAGEKPEVFAARDLEQAMLWLALSHPLELSLALLRGHGEERLNDALFRMKAEQMAADYQGLFGGLAESFGVTLVAGSILLPEPSVVEGVLQPGDGPLYNVSLVFGADGLPIGQPQRKAYPIADEAGFTAAASSQALRVVDTPAGRLGVLICADSWYPQSYAALAAQGVELLAVPAFLTGDGHWRQPWQGYTTFAGTPADVDSQAGELSEGDAWLRHALPGRLASTPARAGLTVFLRGQLWDLGSDGQSLAVERDGHHQLDAGRGARLLNLWL